MTPIRLGIVGPGLMWNKSHKPSLACLPDTYTVGAFCARSEESRQKVSTEFPGVPFYTDRKEMYSSDDIDAVVVLTPIAVNAEATLDALAAGKDVFVEKPLSATVAEAEKVLAESRRTGKFVYVLEQFAYSKVLSLLAQTLKSNPIGDLIMFEQFSHDPIDDEIHTAGGYGQTAWRKEAKFPLGSLYDGGIHTIAVLTELFGMPEKISASGRSLREGFGEYDHVLMDLTYANGFKGVFSHCSWAPGNNNSFNIRGTAGTISVGWNSFTIQMMGGEPETKTAENDNRNVQMWEALAEAFHSRKEAPYSLEHATNDVRLLHYVNDSIKSGTSVTL